MQPSNARLLKQLPHQRPKQSLSWYPQPFEKLLKFAVCQVNQCVQKHVLDWGGRVLVSDVLFGRNEVPHPDMKPVVKLFFVFVALFRSFMAR